MKRNVFAPIILSALLSAASALAQESSTPAPGKPALPPIPGPLGVPKPGLVTDAPYAP